MCIYILHKKPNRANTIAPILYRPFDRRFIVYDPQVVTRPRLKVMRYMLARENLGLITARSNKSDKQDHFFCSQFITEAKCGESTTQSCFFPLYLYSNPHNSIRLEEEERSNISQEFFHEIALKIGYTPIPEAIFYYIYAIFYSPTYRTRYSEFLKNDFPCIPITSNKKLFNQLSTYGKELVALHLIKSPKLDNFITNFVEGGGDFAIDPGHPKHNNSVIIINKKGDRFTGVPEEVWNFHIGGYQVCNKWLKDRIGRILSDEDIQYYQRIIVALKETIELMAKIDAAIPSWPIQ